MKRFLAASVSIAFFLSISLDLPATFGDGGRWSAPTDVPAGTPIRIAYPDPHPGLTIVELKTTGDPVRTAFQKDPISRGNSAWFQLPFQVAKGESIEWELLFDPDLTLPPAPEMNVGFDDRDLIVKYGEQELLRYAIVERTSDELEKDYLTRSGYFHPVTTLAGDVVTDDFSPDHPHQHGIFFAWTESRYGETKTEFWNQHLRRGTIRHAGLGPSGGGPVLAGFETKQVYRLPGTDEPILEETWQARCFVIDADVWLLDLTVKQTALADQPLTNKKYHYGGLGLRGAREWRKDLATFLTSDGHDRIAGNGTRPVWSALSGPAGDRRPTLAVLDYPQNFRYPQPVRLHPDMPYFAIAPMADGPFEVSREEPFAARYGIVVASDALSAERLDALQRAFAADVTLESE